MRPRHPELYTQPHARGRDAVCTAAPADGYVLAGFTGCTRNGTANTCTLPDVRTPATVSATVVPVPAPVPSLGSGALTLLGLGAAGLGVVSQEVVHPR
ncbi:hypothetical protein FVQ98_15910 [Ottowia sp. GY511]|uniref:IPTL-CTERM sorting domain-containing protein n=2 Tax=Ottowia flava TaxID=2675430 RepID=A0ABW4KLU5_9BURK|nr:hypothetical protein [Ottowia sp. GY511]TXK24912.1 hypothetical protein FVQ98_15910 [Ottowia sp. GY511]